MSCKQVRELVLVACALIERARPDGAPGIKYRTDARSARRRTRRRTSPSTSGPSSTAPLARARCGTTRTAGRPSARCAATSSCSVASGGIRSVSPCARFLVSSRSGHHRAAASLDLEERGLTPSSARQVASIRLHGRTTRALHGVPRSAGATRSSRTGCVSLSLSLASLLALLARTRRSRTLSRAVRPLDAARHPQEGRPRPLALHARLAAPPSLVDLFPLVNNHRNLYPHQFTSRPTSSPHLVPLVRLIPTPLPLGRRERVRRALTRPRLARRQRARPAGPAAPRCCRCCECGGGGGLGRGEAGGEGEGERDEVRARGRRHGRPPRLLGEHGGWLGTREGRSPRRRTRARDRADELCAVAGSRAWCNLGPLELQQTSCESRNEYTAQM